MDKTKRERTSPNTLSVAGAKAKADQFSVDNNPVLRAQAKQAILYELNHELQIRAHKIRLQTLDRQLVFPIHSESDVCSQMPCSPQITAPTRSNIPVLDATKMRQDPPMLPKPRKRSARGKTTTSNVVRDYRPGYTWNRGGRLKELRIRCLARKFSRCWVRNTFGRVLPSTAKRHYQQRLVSQTFTAWSDLWWEARKEWRLSVRADLHNRYRLWSFVWRAWRRFTIERRAKTSLLRQARHHADVVLTRTMVHHWLIYVQMRSTKKCLYEKAHHICEGNQLRSAWNIWRRRYHEACAHHQQQTVALQVAAFNTMRRAWCEWQTRYAERTQMVVWYNVAVQHDGRCRLGHCLSAWRHHVAMRRTKAEQNGLAYRLSRQFALRRHLASWRRHWQTTLRLAETRHQVTLLASRIRLRRVMRHWWHYVVLCREKEKMIRSADEHYQMTLTITTFTCLRLRTKQQNLQRLRSAIATRFRCRKLVGRCWRIWEADCERRMELVLLPASRRARTHYSNVCGRKMWTRWRHYHAWRTRRQSQSLLAERHRRAVVLPCVWQALRQHAAHSQHTRALADEADSFRTDALRSRFLHRWSAAFESAREARLMHRVAVMHRGATLAHRFLAAWRWRHRWALDEARKSDIAIDHRKTCLCQHAFDTWRQNTLDARKSYECSQLAARHCYLRRLRKTYAAWKLYTSRRRTKRRKVASAVSHHGGIVVRRAFSRWCSYRAWASETCAYADSRAREKNAQLLRRTFRVWLAATGVIRRAKTEEIVARRHFARGLLKRAVLAWRVIAVEEAARKSRLAAVLQQVTAIFSEAILRRSLVRWRCATRERHLAREQNCRAVEHRRRTVAAHSVATWRQFVSLCIRKRILRRQSALYHRTRLIAKSYLAWRHAHQVALVYQRKTAVALWHWSLVLQRNALVAWFAFTADRKRKAARFADALRWHQSELLRRGVSTMVAVAGDLAQMRHDLAVKQGAEHYHKIQCLVRKCATRWRHRAATSRRASPGQDARVAGGSAHTGMAVPAAGGSARGGRASCRVVLPSTASTSPPRRSGRSEVVRRDASEANRADGAATLAVTVHRPRPAPRRPAFLIESLKRAGLYVDDDAVDDALPSQTVDATPTQIYEERRPQIETGDGPADCPTESVILESAAVEVSRASVERSVRRQTVESSAPRRQLVQESRPTGKSVTFRFAHGDSRLRADDDDSSTSDEAERTSAGRAPSEGERFASTCGSGPAAALRLLPPTAFMSRRDGTPLVVAHGTATQPVGELCRDVADHFDVGARNANDPTSPGDYMAGGDGPQVAAPGDGAEMTYIRRQLKRYEERKAKLRTSRSQQSQLIGWLAEQSPTSNDPYVVEVTQELRMLEIDISELVEDLNRGQKTIQGLAQRGRAILESLQQT